MLERKYAAPAQGGSPDVGLTLCGALAGLGCYAHHHSSSSSITLPIAGL